MSPSGTVIRHRLYQQVAQDLERKILSGIYPADGRLPSEIALAQSYGVSRNVVREALKSLKELGLISIFTGSGSYVRRASPQPLADALKRYIRHSPNRITIAQLYDVRRMVEPECARLAAERATEAEVQTIVEAQSAIEKNRDNPGFSIPADLEFHLAIAAATHNPLVTTLLNPVIVPLHRLISATHGNPSRLHLALNGHPPIVAAIRRRDPKAAYRAMLDHLEAGVQRYNGDVGLSPDDLL